MTKQSKENKRSHEMTGVLGFLLSNMQYVHPQKLMSPKTYRDFNHAKNINFNEKVDYVP